MPRTTPRRVPIRCEPLMLLLAATVVACGCAGPRFEHAPPVVSTSIFVDKGTGRAIGVASEDRLLTVAHGLGLHLPDGHRMDNGSLPAVVRGASGGGAGGWVGLTIVDHGDLERLASLGKEVGFQAFAQDWAIARADRPLLAPPEDAAPGAATKPGWRIGAWPPRWGEVLYVVRPAPASDRGRVQGQGQGGYQWVRMRVQQIEPVEGLEMPGNVGVGQSGQGRLGPGWSGSFVGRYDNGWEFVALFAGNGQDSQGRRFDIIVRPPEHALRWMFELGETDPAR